MPENKKTKSLPRFASLDQLVDHFDSHDLGEYMDQMEEADFEVELDQRTHSVTLDADQERKLAKLARAQHLPSTTLLNNWVKEKLRKAS